MNTHIMLAKRITHTFVGTPLPLRKQRSLWTYAEGKTIGYVESIFNKGYIFKHPEIRFRITSNNMSGDDFNVSYVSVYNLDANSTELLNKCHLNRVPIEMTFDFQIFNVPWKNDTICGNFANAIKPLNADVVLVEKNKNV